MLFNRTYQFYITGFSLFLTIACIEDIEFETETFESALVIEATITNEMKPQQIILSRTYKFEEDGPNPESGANVSIISDNGVFNFTETEAGIYISENEFSAQQNNNYRLNVVTSNGRSYMSSPTQLTNNLQIDELYALRETNDDGINGMSFYVDSFDPTGNSNYYRYEYEETYKIIAPRWVPQDLIVTDADLCEVEVVDKTQEERVCFNTVSSVNLNLINTNSLTEDRVSRHLIRFIASDNYIISYRYSILVKQYIQSREAFTYFETLNDFSGEGSLFSQTQPGFLRGNIVSENNSDEKVVGFFDVSSVSSKRIYFNYDDFYNNEPVPPYYTNCNEIQPKQFILFGCGPLIDELLRNRIKYVSVNENPGPTEGPYNVVIRACGDCTALGSNIVPNFWEE